MDDATTITATIKTQVQEEYDKFVFTTISGFCNYVCKTEISKADLEEALTLWMALRDKPNENVSDVIKAGNAIYSYAYRRGYNDARKHAETVDWHEYPKEKPAEYGGAIVTYAWCKNGKKSVCIACYNDEEDEWYEDGTDERLNFVFAWAELPKPHEEGAEE